MIPLSLDNILDTKEHRNNVPIPSRKSVPNEHLVHTSGHKRRYVKKAQVKELAEKNYSENGRGITILDIMMQFKVKQEKAQRTLKNLHTKKFLFTGDDLEKQRIFLKGFKRENPQKYYLTGMKAKIIEDNENNVLKDTTGVNPVEEGAMENMTFVLNQLGTCGLYIHKLQMKTSVNKKHYSEISSVKSNGVAKIHYERIREHRGKPEVEYKIYSNGTVMIYVTCSQFPFGLQNEEDVFAINSYLGRVEDRLKYVFADTRNEIVPPALNWILTGCDVNKDMQVGDMAQLTDLDMQIKSALGVFRGYVKRIEDKVLYRVEQSLTPNEPLSTAFETLRKGVKIDKDFLSL